MSRRSRVALAAALALIALAQHATSQCNTLPCEPRPLPNTYGVTNDLTGAAIAIDGDIAVVGAPGVSGSTESQGRAIVYQRQQSTGEWVEVAVLEQLVQGGVTAEFGRAVDIVGDTILVGDPFVSENGSQSGAAYVYEEPPGGWSGTLTENAMLLASTIVGPPGDPQDNVGFLCGTSVALSADQATAYVGVPNWHDNASFAGRRREGRVMVFRRPGPSWGDAMSRPTHNEAAQLARSENAEPYLTGFTSLGTSLVVTAHPSTGRDRVITGAIADNVGGAGSECGVWIFEEPAPTMGVTWESSMLIEFGRPVTMEPMAFRGSTSGSRDNFGECLALIDASNLVVGSPSQERAFVFTEVGGVWCEEGILAPCDVGSLGFGEAVAATSSGTVLVSAPVAGTADGGVYTFTRGALAYTCPPAVDPWSSDARIRPRFRTIANSHGFNTAFGASICADGNALLVGKPTANTLGSLYELELEPDCTCTAAPDGITNWWTGDGDFADLVGGQHGVAQGGASIGAGLVDQGMALNAGSVEFGTSAGNFGTGDFTVELWLNYGIGSFPSFLVYMDKHDGAGQGWQIDNVNFGGQLRFLAESGGTEVDVRVNMETLLVFDYSVWNHAAITRSGSTYSIYWNGDLVIEQTDAVIDVSSSEPLSIAMSMSSMDEIAFYDRALSHDEIRDTVFTYRSGKCKDIDLTPPTVMITGPPADRKVSGTVPYTADAMDLDSGVWYVDFYVDGIYLGADPTAPYEVSLDTTLLSRGQPEHGLFVEAFDNAGNSASDTSRMLVKQPGPGTRLYTGGELPEFEHNLDDAFLVVDPGSGSITAMVPLRNANPGHDVAREFELRIVGGETVRAEAVRVLTGRQPAVLLAFDRQALLGSIASAISAGEIDPRSGVEAELYLDGVFVGRDRL